MFDFEETRNAYLHQPVLHPKGPRVAASVRRRPASLFELRRTMPDTASPKTMLLYVAAPREAPSGRSVVPLAGTS